MSFNRNAAAWHIRNAMRKLSTLMDMCARCDSIGLDIEFDRGPTDTESTFKSFIGMIEDMSDRAQAKLYQASTTEKHVIPDPDNPKNNALFEVFAALSCSDNFEYEKPAWCGVCRKLGAEVWRSGEFSNPQDAFESAVARGIEIWGLDFARAVAAGR